MIERNKKLREQIKMKNDQEIEAVEQFCTFQPNADKPRPFSPTSTKKKSNRKIERSKSNRKNRLSKFV